MALCVGMSAAGAFLDSDVGETAFTAALESWLESQKKTMYEPRIQQKPLSAYTLWKLVAKGGGSKMVRPSHSGLHHDIMFSRLQVELSIVPG